MYYYSNKKEVTLDKVHFYSVVGGTCSMMVAMMALLAAMWGVLQPEVATIIVQTFGLVAAMILFGGYAVATFNDWKHSRATDAPKPTQRKARLCGLFISTFYTFTLDATC